MIEIRTAHTSDLDKRTLQAARDLLKEVFGDDLTDEDWEHALGGIHALTWSTGELVGHASVIQRRLIHAGRALRTGYVEAVGVRPDHQRQGHATAMMTALERVIKGAYDLGALGATDEAARMYESRGWLKWQGTTWALTPQKTIRTEEDDNCIYVLPTTTPLDITAPLTCDWRDGDPW
jgi:aminoglycoside 2'-N-acetyltransferase I